MASNLEKIISKVIIIPAVTLALTLSNGCGSAQEAQNNNTEITSSKDYNSNKDQKIYKNKSEIAYELLGDIIYKYYNKTTEKEMKEKEFIAKQLLGQSNVYYEFDCDNRACLAKYLPECEDFLKKNMGTLSAIDRTTDKAFKENITKDLKEQGKDDDSIRHFNNRTYHRFDDIVIIYSPNREQIIFGASFYRAYEKQVFKDQKFHIYGYFKMDQTKNYQLVKYISRDINLKNDFLPIIKEIFSEK